MAVITRILVPMDFSPCASRALEHAIHLATKLVVPLLLVHVHAPPTVSLPHDVTEMPETEAEVHAVLTRGLTQMAAHARERGAYDVDTLLAGGTPGEELGRIARQHACDLIVMGTHGRSGVRHLLLGSVAEHVVRLAACPVLVVGPRALAPTA